MRFLTLFALFIASMAVVFSLQNSTQVLIRFFQWQSLQSMGLVLLFTFATGVLLGLLISLPTTISRLAKITKLKQTVEKQALELQHFHQSPPSDQPPQDANIQDNLS